LKPKEKKKLMIPFTEEFKIQHAERERQTEDNILTIKTLRQGKPKEKRQASDKESQNKEHRKRKGNREYRRFNATPLFFFIL
jgi:hypothetical protein